MLFSPKADVRMRAAMEAIGTWVGERMRTKQSATGWADVLGHRARGSARRA